MRIRPRVCGVSPSVKRKLLDEARLADAGFADHERELALASQHPLPATVQEVELLLAPGERE